MRLPMRWFSPLRRRLRLSDVEAKPVDAHVAGAHLAAKPPAHQHHLRLEDRFSPSRENGKRMKAHSPKFLKGVRKSNQSFSVLPTPDPGVTVSSRSPRPALSMEDQKLEHDYFRESSVGEIQVFLQSRDATIQWDRCVSAVFQRHSASEAASVLHMIVERVEEGHHPEESLDWNVCVREASRHGLLSICVPYLSTACFLSSVFTPGGGEPRFSIQEKMWQFDWDDVRKAIPNADARFHLERPAYCTGNASTSALWRLLSFYSSPSPSMVSEYVQQGAEISVGGSVPDGTVLHLLLKRCSSRIVRTALCSTTDAVNFTVTEERYPGSSALHLLCGRADPLEARAVLAVVVDRLQQHPVDAVDFGQERSGGMDFISLAAFLERLALFWPLVRDMPYFADSIDGIPLKGKVYRWDWSALGVDEQSHFICPQKLW